jgi:subtilisin-like proprotein convertase family protein
VASLNSFADSIYRLQQAEEGLSMLGEVRSLVAQTSGAEALSTGTIRGENPSGRKWTLVVEEEISGASGRVHLFRISAAMRSKDQKAPLIMLRTLTVSGLKPE